MADLNKGRYEQKPEFEADVNDPLVEISSLTDSIDGKEITIRLNKNRNIGSFESSTDED
ncbi:hypothetical protein ZOSMA_61G00250 [Zostera marina]|uniref:Uncharacterized protein n=1 Tax=Zostera marina TaxID=29655 RepID=A0A0K9NVF9_ZOSMR|nr:hypothetical protein ZOSMA_61G00250 [Zostera marina]